MNSFHIEKYFNQSLTEKVFEEEHFLITFSIYITDINYVPVRTLSDIYITVIK